MAGIIYRLGDYLRDVGEYNNNFLTRLTQRLVVFECELWNQYPDRITNNTLIPANYSRAFYAGLCGGDSDNQLIIPNGCEKKIYVFGTYTSKLLTSCNQESYWRNSVGIPESIYFTNTPILNEDNNRWQIPTTSGIFFDLREINETLYDNNNIGDNPNLKLQNREPGQTCLNVTNSSYGHSLEYQKTVVENPTDTNCLNTVNYPETNPPPIIFKTDSVEVNNTFTQIDIVVLTDDGGNIGFPHNTYVNGVEVNINLGGFNFSTTNNLNFGGGGGINELPENTQNPETPTDVYQPNDDGGGSDGGGSGVIPVQPTPPLEDLIEEDLGEQDSLDRDNLPLLERVTLTLAMQPSKGRIQSGVDGPDVIYCGWFEFKQNSFHFPRRPIHFERNVFDAPSGADGFAFTLYYGYTGIVKTYQRP